MEIKIEWSELSTKQLAEIHSFYSRKAGSRIARKIINRIFSKVDILYQNPLAGQREELLNKSPENFRYLVESNYKIIYWLSEDTITIASVFDCRQNPVKMKRI